jgi:hypothetical protein
LHSNTIKKIIRQTITIKNAEVINKNIKLKKFKIIFLSFIKLVIIIEEAEATVLSKFVILL